MVFLILAAFQLVSLTIEQLGSAPMFSGRGRREVSPVGGPYL